VRPAQRRAAPRFPARAVGAGRTDQVELVALVAHAKRELLLRVHRHRLRPEDLEDCFSQATLELLASVRRGRLFAGREHLANALEQRFQSRIRDRRRALSGRSPLLAALEDAVPLGGRGDREVEVRDARADVHQLVARRMDLRRLLEVAPGLSSDQRLVLAFQAFGVGRAEFCRRFGWSFEKYRKVAQRARARLGDLMDLEQHARSVEPRRSSMGPHASSATEAMTSLRPAPQSGVPGSRERSE
jgi:hypothetical protein